MKTVSACLRIQHSSCPGRNYCCSLATERNILVKLNLPDKNTAWVLCYKVVSKIVSGLPGG